MNARLMLPPSMADVRRLAQEAPIVFRGRVVNVASTGKRTNGEGTIGPVFDLASFEVDRIYRGEITGETKVLFAYTGPNGGVINGHFCIDFQPGTHWIVFAKQSTGHLSLTDDCEGALGISSRLGPELTGGTWESQMEADFEAGLDDPEAEARIWSLQRLGGLKLASSRAVLHRVLEQGEPSERDWAVFAALRTGDVSVLARVRDLLVGETKQPWEWKSPAREVLFELRNVKDPAAVPELVAIFNGATVETTRQSALLALANIRDPRAAVTFASALSDKDGEVRYLGLEGLSHLTKSCALPEENNSWPAVDRKASLCREWWEREGKHVVWDQGKP